MNLSSSIEVTIKCTKCGRKIKKRLSELHHKRDITCRCGAILTVDPKGFKSVGQRLDDLKKGAAKLGK